jgi:glycosyltransferase involved in cell wall biosynthesis
MDLVNESVETPSVAMLCHGTEGYGMQRVVLDLLTHIPDSRLVVLRAGCLSKRAESLSVPVTIWKDLDLFGTDRLQIRTLSSLLITLHRKAALVARRCHDEGIQILHTHMMPLSLLAGLACRKNREGLRCVWHLHLIPGLGHFAWLTVPLNRIGGLLLSGRIIAVSKATAKPYQSWFRDHVRVVYNGIPQPVTVDGVRVAELQEQFRRKWNCTVCWAGRIVRTKGLHVAIEAFGRLGRCDTGLVVLGDTKDVGCKENGYLDELDDLIRRYNLEARVKFLGRVDHVIECMAASDIVLHTRIDPEPCSMVIIEALSTGKALIASASGGTPELVRDGETGLLVRPGDVEDHVRALERLIGDIEYRKTIAEQAQRDAQARFVLDRVASEVKVVYRELMG